MIDSDEHNVVWDKVVGIMVPLTKCLQNISFYKFKLRSKLTIISSSENSTTKESRFSADNLDNDLELIKSKIDTFKNDYKTSMDEIDSLKEQFPSERTGLITSAAYENMEILLNFLNNQPPSYVKMQQEIALLKGKQVSEPKKLSGDNKLDI